LLKVGRIQISLSGVALLTCMPSVGAWRRLGECSTSCHLEILSLGMISLFILFCQLVAVEVWWMKAGAVMLQCQTIVKPHSGCAYCEDCLYLGKWQQSPHELNSS
jgi:hypothetical protein